MHNFVCFGDQSTNAKDGHTPYSRPLWFKTLWVKNMLQTDCDIKSYDKTDLFFLHTTVGRKLQNMYQRNMALALSVITLFILCEPKNKVTITSMTERTGYRSEKYKPNPGINHINLEDTFVIGRHNSSGGSRISGG